MYEGFLGLINRFLAHVTFLVCEPTSNIAGLLPPVHHGQQVRALVLLDLVEDLP